MLITGGADATRTTGNYRKFFGSQFEPGNGASFEQGLDDDAIDRLIDLGALRRTQTKAA